MLTLCLASTREARALCAAVAEEPALPVRVLVTGYRNRLLKSGFVPSRAPGGSFEDFLIAGFGGAVNPALPTGTFFIPRRIHASDKAPLPADPSLRELLRETLAAGKVPYRVGNLLTVDRPVLSTVRKCEIFERGFDAVDMESYGLTERLIRRGSRVAVLRLISDTADERAFSAYYSRRKSLSEKMSDVLIAFSKKFHAAAPPREDAVQAEPCP